TPSPSSSWECRASASSISAGERSGPPAVAALRPMPLPSFQGVFAQGPAGSVISFIRKECRRCLMLRQTVVPGIGRCFSAIGTAGLGENVAHMAGDGTEADAQGVSDISVALACGKQAEHLYLALTEIVKGVKSGGHWSWPLLKAGDQALFKGRHPQCT